MTTDYSQWADLSLGPPFLDPTLSPGDGSGHSGEALCILHKAQVWTAYTLASTIFKSFKPEDLSWANFPFSLFLLFFWGKKINYAIVYTPGCIRRRGISVLKRPGVNWGYFSVFGFLFGGMYSWPTPWNVIPTFDLRQDTVWVCVLGGTRVCHMLLLPNQDSCHPVSPLVTKPPRLSCLLELFFLSKLESHFPNLIVCWSNHFLWLWVRRLLFENRLVLRKQRGQGR